MKILEFGMKYADSANILLRITAKLCLWYAKKEAEHLEKHAANVENMEEKSKYSAYDILAMIKEKEQSNG